MKFRVEQLIEIGREVSVFARQLDEGNFVLSGAPRVEERNNCEFERIICERPLTREASTDAAFRGVRGRNWTVALRQRR